MNEKNVYMIITENGVFFDRAYSRKDIAESEGLDMKSKEVKDFIKGAEDTVYKVNPNCFTSFVSITEMHKDNLKEMIEDILEVM